MRPLKSSPSILSKTSAPRDGSILNKVKSEARKHQVHRRIWLFFESGLVDVEDLFQRQARGEVVVGVGDAARDFGDDFGKKATADFDAEEIAEKAFDGGVRAVTGAFEVADQGSEPGPSKAGAGSGRVEGGVMNLFALATPTGVRADAGDGDHFAGHEDLDLLHDFGGKFAGRQRAMAIGTFAANDFGIGDIVVVEGLSPMRLVSGLSTAFAFAVVGIFFLFRLGLGFAKVAGGGLG